MVAFPALPLAEPLPRDMFAALPVWPTTKAILAFCRDGRGLLAKHAVVPLVLLMGIDVFGTFSDVEIRPEVWQGATGLLALFFYAPLLVTWYRTVAFGEQEARQRPAFSFGLRDGFVIVVNILVTIVGLLALVPLGGIVLLAGGLLGRISDLAGEIASVALAIPAAFAWFIIYTRLSVALAFAATGHYVGLRETWRLTAPFGLAMTLVHASLGLIMAAGWGLVAIVVLGGMTAADIPFDGEDAGPIAQMTVSLLSTLFEMSYLIVTTTLFGIVYRRIQDPAWPSLPPKEAPSPSP